MPETGESSLGLLNEGLERRVRTLPLCQDLLVLLPGLGSAPQLVERSREVQTGHWSGPFLPVGGGRTTDSCR